LIAYRDLPLTRTITVSYYHAPGADKTPTAAYELFEQIILAEDPRGGDREGRE
jgi:hypothetical protein